MIPAEAKPSKKIAELVIRLVEVRLFFTLRYRLSTPVLKVFISCSSALKQIGRAHV